MSKLDSLLQNFKHISETPEEQLQEFLATPGAKAIGSYPIYVPEQIVHAAGMLPIGIWGGQAVISKAKTYLPAFACSIMQSCMEYGLSGVYDKLEGVIIPAHCDTFKCFGQNWNVGVKQVEYIPLVYPHNRKLEVGVNFLISELTTIQEKMERISGKKITQEELHKSIEIYNQHRRTMREFVDVAAYHLDIITPVLRHAVIKSAFFILKERHTAMVKELIAELKALPRHEFKGLKVVLTGIMAEPDGLLELMQENNIAVVADDLAQESRQFRVDVPEGDNALERLARWWSVMEGCPLVYDPAKKRDDILVETVRRYKADGIGVCMMKFCDPEEFDYPIYIKRLAFEKIPHFYVEIDQQMQNNEQARTRIQTFAEIIENKSALTV